jgi:phenylacetate-CoA ligase
MSKGAFRSVRALTAWLRAEREQWLPAEALRDRQWDRLRAIVTYAAERSPFYRRRFAEAGFAPADLRDWDALRAIPPTTREDLRDAQSLIADGHARAGMRRAFTSGSTGMPTETYWDPDGWILSKYLLKARARRACGVRPWDRVALLQEIGPGEESRRFALRPRSFSIHRPLGEAIDALRAYAPTVLYGFPGYLARLGERATGAITPRLIFTSGEMLDRATRRAIEFSFGAPVFDIYGCTEIKEIAWECPARTGYHLNADWTVVEVEPGGRGSLLVTSLANRGMPLLRYRLGDTGSLMAGLCPCGRGLPLMAPALGRSVDYLVLRDGSAVSPYALTCALETVEAVRQYQVVQETIERIVVKVVPGRGFGETTEREIREKLRPLVGGLEAEVRRVPSIEPSRTGKYRVVESRCADARTP